jgi:hypothetical protein
MRRDQIRGHRSYLKYFNVQGAGKRVRVGEEYENR